MTDPQYGLGPWLPWAMQADVHACEHEAGLGEV
jgi:hypothetical protein